MVAFAVFAVGWNAEKFSESNYFVFLGVAYLFVGSIDLLHTFAYAGMGVFPEYDANLPTQLWIIARYMEAVSLLLVWFMKDRSINKYLLFVVYLAISVLFCSLAFIGLFPVCWVQGVGLTLFKVASEYVIIGLIAISILIMRKNRRDLDESFYRYLSAALVLTIGAELSFTLYFDVYGFFNVVGHFFKLLSFGMIYLAIIKGSLENPYEVLFRELDERRKAEVERSENLARINKQLESFSASLSHDIRNPLSVIILSAEMLRNEVSSASAKSYIDDIVTKAKHASALVEDLLRLSYASKGTLTNVEVNLSEVITSILAEAQEKEPDRIAVLSIQPDIIVRCDANLIRLALENLLTNAWKYTGGRDTAKIDFGVHYQNAYPVYFVRDNGIGFDMSEAEDIFKPFVRASNALGFEGTGIGLTIVQQIIKAHAGDIWFESEIDKGTTFYFTLYVSRNHAASNGTSA